MVKSLSKYEGIHARVEEKISGVQWPFKYLRTSACALYNDTMVVVEQPPGKTGAWSNMPHGVAKGKVVVTRARKSLCCI